MIPDIARYPRFLGGGRIEFSDKPVPRPGAGELLLRVRANALCGSERGQYANGAPITPGHEAVGVVVEAGPEAQTPVGTLGAVFLMDFCGMCRNCRRGRTNQCLHKRADMGFTHDGGYGPYELVHESIFFPIGADASPAEATLLLDVMGTNGHAIRRARLVHDDIRSALVSGAGPIGLGMLAMLKLTFGESLPVGITDVMPWRLALAEKLGGLPINLRAGSLSDGLRPHGLTRVDVAFDTSGKQAAREACVQALDKCGALVCIGHGEGVSLNVSADLISTERAVLGSEYFCFDELPANLSLLQQHHAYLNQIITHRFGVDDIGAAFELFWRGETGKVVIEQ
jgi:threonine dehydrogenase-like Zn-dependent dehydrogenase